MLFVLELFFYFCFYKLMRHEKPFLRVVNLHLSNQPAKLQSLVEIFLKVGTYATMSLFSI